MSDYTVRTLKIKVYPETYSGGDAKAAWKRLRDIAYWSRRAANECIGLQYWNDVTRNMADGVTGGKEFDGMFKEFFGVGRNGAGYRLIVNKYDQIPSNVAVRISNTVYSLYTQERKAVLTGERSIRSYKAGMPIPVSEPSIAFSAGPVLTWTLSRTEKMTFAFVFGRDKGGYSETIQRIVDGKLDYGAPSLQFKDGDLYLLLPVKDDRRENTLDASRSVGVDLGVAIPAVCALSDGPARLFIGRAEDFLRVRTRLQAMRRSAQRNARETQGGHGRVKKLAALERYTERERDFVKTYNHTVSRRIVEFALKHGAGTIKLELLEGFGDERKKNDYILRNWSYFELQTMIKYKADAEGIAVVSIDPYHTSQTCSKCGHHEGGQRQTQSKFVCAKCGNEENADYNAARNIAMSDKIVTAKEQCEYRRKSGRLTSEPEGEAKALAESA